MFLFSRKTQLKLNMLKWLSKKKQKNHPGWLRKAVSSPVYSGSIQILSRISRSPDVGLYCPDFEPFLLVSRFMSIYGRLGFLTHQSEMCSVVSCSVQCTSPPTSPPLPPHTHTHTPTEPLNLALLGRLCKALCYCWPGKSYSPYLKTCEVDSPGLVTRPTKRTLKCFLLVKPTVQFSS